MIVPNGRIVLMGSVSDCLRKVDGWINPTKIENLLETIPCIKSTVIFNKHRFNISRGISRSDDIPYASLESILNAIIIDENIKLTTFNVISHAINVLSEHYKTNP